VRYLSVPNDIDLEEIDIEVKSR